MNLGKINVITPPDKLYNMTPSLLLIKPSLELKEHFQKCIAKFPSELNVFVFGDIETDIDWMLSVHKMSDITVIDIDNCDPITRSFVTLMLTFPDTYYMTKDEVTPYGLLSKNRIYDFDSIPFFILVEDEEDEDEEEEGEQ